jgi:uncharacterized protein YfaS (alpha-2-macroglobulin family)
MTVLRKIFGRIQWIPPKWLQHIGGRRFGVGLAISALIAIVAVVGFNFYQSLPKPAQVVAETVAPGITPIVDGELRPQALVLNFSVKPDPRTPVITVDSVARIDQIGEVVSEGISISPAIGGEWRWANENQLSFAPSEDWPAGQEYIIRYDSELFAPNLELAKNETTFTTPGFNAKVTELVFYQDPVEQSLRKVVGTLTFSHPVDPASLQQHLTYSMREPGATVQDAAQNVTYEVQFDEHRRTAYVHSSPIEIPAQENYLTLHLSEGLAPGSGPSRFSEELLQNVRIPDVGSYFRVSNAQGVIARDDNDDPVQTLTIEFTDRVATDRLQEKLTAYVLPKDVRINGTRHRNMRWQTPRQVTPDILQQAEKLEIELTPIEDDSAALHSAAIDVPENRWVYLKIDEGLNSDADFVLSRPYDTVVRIPGYPKEAKIAQSGAVLPLTSTHRLTFVSRGVEALRVELGRLIDHDVNHLASQTGGDIKSPYFNNYQFDQDNVTSRVTKYIDLNTEHSAKSVFSSLDLSEYLPDGGYYFVAVQGWDKEKERPIGTADRRFILITDIGLLVKSNADSTQDVYVHSIATGNPIAGASVALLGKNGAAIIERTSSSGGHVSMPATNDFEREKTPTVFVVRDGADSIFMPYARHARMLQYSRFDVGGEFVQQRPDDEQIKAQVFTDRGIYRPGDTVKIASIVKRDDWGSLGNVPLVVRIIDPRGQVALDKNIRLPDDGFLEAEFPTELASPTGNYNATLFLIEDRNRRRSIGSESFKVEEFLPDRLRINTQILGQKPNGWLKPGDLVAQVDLENLFGTPAQSRRVTGQMDLVPSGIRMSQYPEFVFDDPLREHGALINRVKQDLAETVTNADGRARLPLDLARYDKGIYRLSVLTEGYEEGGGRSVKAQASVMMSPLDYLIGYKTDSDLSFINKGSEHAVDFLAVDSNAETMALDDLRLSIVEYRYVSTLVKRPNGTYAYQSVRKEIPLSTQDFSISGEGAQFLLPTTGAGSFAVKITDANDLPFSKVDYTVAGARNVAGNLERDAELQLIINGDSFSPGEDIEMEITAPYTGVGLITIERDRVYAHKWFQSDTNTTVQTIRVPDELEGNAYVNVAFIRELDSPEIYVSPLSYAVMPFSINRSARTVEIDIEVPELLRPGDELEIAYSTSRDARIVIYAVDEGILQVARYNMPDPLAFFLRKMALQVSTFQMVDLILPDFDAYQQSASPGGGDAAGLAGSNLNPFRRKTDAPVAFWSGIIDAGPERSTYAFQVPDYFNGQLRVMAIAVTDAALGRHQDTTVVRGPFVITPNVLTAAAPGDEFEVNVGLANNLEGSGTNANIDLSVTPSEHLDIVGEDRVTLQIAEGNEGRSKFRIRARDRLGPASLTFEASSGDELARLQATLSVRPSVAYVATVAAGSSDDDPIDLQFKRSMYDEFARQSAAASKSPLVLADGLLSYLDAFPHACTEQIVSKVFPQIGFLGNDDYQVDEGNVRTLFGKTTRKLRSRQGSEGGFRFWATSTEPASFPSAYIMHFFTDAEELGLPVPADMKRSGLGYIQQLAATEVRTISDARLRAYAIYILTRNGTVTTNYLTNLHEHLDQTFQADWRNDLAAAYMAASYELLKQSQLGNRLIRGYEPGSGDEMTSDFDTRLGRDAQYVYLVARHFPNRLSDIDASTIQRLIEPVMQNRFNTLSSSYTILALGEYARAIFDGSDSGSLTISASANDAVEMLTEAARFARAEINKSISSVQISGSNGDDIYYVLSQTGFDAAPPQDALSEGLEIQRTYLNDDSDPVTSALIGDELTVRLRIRSTGRPRTNVAVVDMLPGGFEVLADSVRREHGGWSADYMDIREDRVVVYGSFADRVTEVQYRVKLTSAGLFVMPSAFAGSMYDRSIQARTKPGRFEVRSTQ